jgi:hypothetical protein
LAPPCLLEDVVLAHGALGVDVTSITAPSKHGKLPLACVQIVCLSRHNCAHSTAASGVAPLLHKLLKQQSDTGMPPAYLPKDERDDQ